MNNAGDMPAGALGAIDEAKWRHAWELKVFGFINLTRAVLARHGVARPRRDRERDRHGAASGTRPTTSPGAAGNAALEGFTKGVGKGSVRKGVRVVGLHPGATRTERLELPLRLAAKQRFGDESRWAELLRGQQIQEPEQVADTVVFLASERARHLSGVVLNLTPA